MISDTLWTGIFIKSYVKTHQVVFVLKVDFLHRYSVLPAQGIRILWRK
jgi:hypothetical protein